MRINVPIGGGFYVSDAEPLSVQSCQNLYPVIPQNDRGLSTEALYQIQGQRSLVSTGTEATAPFRLAKFCSKAGTSGRVYWFAGRHIRHMLGSGTDVTWTLVDTISNYWGKVSAAFNENYLIWVSRDGVRVSDGATGQTDIGYLDFATNTVNDLSATFSGLGLGTPVAFEYIDGYFVAATDDDKILVSESGDPSSWSALDFGSAEADPDGLVAPFVFNNQLFVFGEQTYEIFQNVGGTGFPFQRIPGAIFDVGLISRQSIVKTGTAMYFVGTRENTAPAIYRSTGGGFEKISNNAVDIALQDDSGTDETVAWHYTMDGHSFVGFNLDFVSLVYDESTGRWHTRTSNSGGTTYSWGVDVFVRAFGSQYIGNNTFNSSYPNYTGRASLLDPDYGDEPADDESMFVSPAIHRGDMQPFSLNTVELTVQHGSLASGFPFTPRISLEISRDGVAWSTVRWRNIGKGDENTNKRLIWRRNGRIPRYCYLRFTQDTAQANSATQVRILRLDVEIQ